METRHRGLDRIGEIFHIDPTEIVSGRETYPRSKYRRRSQSVTA